MKTSLRILLSVLAITSTMALAEESVQRNFSLDKFSYLGVGMKDTKADLVAKGFECVGSECKREDSKANINVSYSGDKMQNVETKTFYQKGINCAVNQNEIKDFLTTNYNFEYVNQDRTLFGYTITSRMMGGNIKTTEGKVFINVDCSYNSETNKYYAYIDFNLVDIVYQDFKKDFKYQ